MIALLLALLASPARAQSAGTVLDQLADTERQLLDVQAEMLRIEAQKGDLDGELQSHQLELAKAQEVVDGRSERVRQIIRLAYLINRRGFARILFSAEDPSDLRRRSRYLLSLLSHTDSMVESFRGELDKRREAVKEVEARQAELSTLQAQFQEKESELLAEREARRALLEQVRASETLMRQADARTVRASQTLHAEPIPQAAAPTPTLRFRDQQGRLPSPVTRGTRLSSFGGGNRGVDLLAPAYSTVRVVADGVVIRGEPIAGLGMTIVVDHGDGFTTVYAHLGQSKVRVGQQLKQGDYIGVVGETGVVDQRGPRVHFEVRYRNTPQNPDDWLGS
ncbi:MAG: peptidoglycan DD-metalloendopeptidase family protein [Myxococcota bacterium]|nr:peptidoglycan DD-metalloendopeptidase family protein [Myxococcota bacterium]